MAEMEKNGTVGAFTLATDNDMSDTHGSTTSKTTAIQAPPTVNEKALVRKIDLRLLPVLFVIYLAAFLDRVNISNALIMGLPKDLHLKGNQTNVALTIFFVPYIVFEIPSNILLKRLKPHVWLSGCILAFGIVMLAQGFVKSYSGLLATRFFLGLAEAGIFPGSFYLISFWYKREESQQRFTIYWCSVLTASAFGGLLASAIGDMKNVRGYSAWRWVFILEGIATIVIGVAAFFLVSDFPEDARWLTEDERTFVTARAAANKQDGERITFKKVLLFFTDVKHLLAGIMYFAIVIPIYSFAYFAPTIIKTLGYTTVQTQLHTVPPVVAALGLCLLLAFSSDFTKIRLPYILLGQILVIIGLAILMSVHHTYKVEYFAIHLVAMGAFAAGPIIVCWYVMNLKGHVERSVGTAWMIGFGNSGGIVATFSFLATDAPKYYHKGYSICMSMTVLGLVAAVLYGGLVWRENRKMSRTGGEKGGRYYSL